MKQEDLEKLKKEIIRNDDYLAVEYKHNDSTRTVEGFYKNTPSQFTLEIRMPTLNGDTQYLVVLYSGIVSVYVFKEKKTYR